MKRRALWAVVVLIQCVIALVIGIADGRYKADLSVNVEQYETGDFVSPVLTGLRRGVWQVTLGYNADDNEGVSYVREAGDTPGYALTSGDNPLWSYRDETIYRFYINRSDSSCEVVCEAPQESGLRINAVEVRYLPFETAARSVICLMAIMLLVDALFLMIPMWRRMERVKRLTVCAVICTGLASLIPMYLPGIVDGDDLSAHLTRIRSLAEGLRYGQLPVRLEPYSGNGHGFPWSIMYGDLLLYPSAVLYLCGFSLCFTYKLLMLYTSLLTSYISYRCFKIMSGDRWLGLVGCVCYTLSPWRLTDMYRRAAVGEHTAMMFLPLVALGAWALERDGEERRAERALLIGFSGLLMTHNITAVLAAEAFLVYIIFNWRVVMNRSRLLLLVRTAVKGVLLNLWFLIPFLDYYMTVPMRINAHETPERSIQYQGAVLSELIGIGVDEARLARDSAAQFYAFGPGIAMNLCLLAAIIGLVMGIWHEKRRIMLLSVGTLLTLFMSSSYFPYDLMLERAPWLYSAFDWIQFPWRYLTITTISGVLLILSVMSELGRLMPRFYHVLLVGVVTLTVIQGISYQYSYSALRYPEARAEIDHEADSLKGYSLYMLYGFTKSDYRVVPRIVTSGDLLLARSVSRRGLMFEIDVTNSGENPGTLTIPLAPYKYLNVYGNDIRLMSEINENGEMDVMIPAGFKGRVTTSFDEPWFWRISEVISFITVVLLIMVDVSSRRRQ